MLTSEDIKKLKGLVATKQDLKKVENNFIRRSLEVFATKEDLKKLENDFIRRSLEVFATKEDLKEFVTISMFKEAMESVIEKLDALYTEVKNLSDEKLINSEFRLETREEIENIKHRLAAKS